MSVIESLTLICFSAVPISKVFVMLEVRSASLSTYARDHFVAKQTFQLDYKRGTHKVINIASDDSTEDSSGIEKVWMQYSENISGFR